MNYVALKDGEQAGAGRDVPPVVLVALGYIDIKTARLDADGGHTTEDLPDGPWFDSLELTGELRPCYHPTYEPFALDTGNAGKCVRKLQMKAPGFDPKSTGGTRPKGSWAASSRRVRFRHQLFERRLRVGDDGEYTAPTSEEQKTLDEYTFRHRQTCDRFVENEHRLLIIPLPAFSAGNVPILPRDYHTALPGAFVELFFTLKHCHFSDLDDHSFNADIVRLNVLVPPQKSSRRLRPPFMKPIAERLTEQRGA
ncbi:hypothetical protein EV121DRAFT_276227 [Schizophyllum commune]|nr:uncharacterized protein SCHCODRAFT_02696125 [Schizophyllum commune H4-8]KAI5897423.1 hypothetical protein SCHCODRAFT_02696125 [Schizophyllum commune H4-8]